MWQTILGSVIGRISDIIDQYVQDKDKALELKTQIEKEIITLQRQILQSQTQIITAEAKSESWLTRNWRPITMLTFVSLIVADWLGFTAPNLTPELKGKLFDIIQIGLGGYVIGRSAEKVARELKPLLGKRKEPQRPIRPADEEDEIF
jgi:hypothetical protein